MNVLQILDELMIYVWKSLLCIPQIGLVGWSGLSLIPRYTESSTHVAVVDKNKSTYTNTLEESIMYHHIPYPKKVWRVINE